MKPTDKMLEHVRVTISELENELFERAMHIKELTDKLTAIRKIAHEASLVMPTKTPDDLVRHCLELSW